MSQAYEDKPFLSGERQNPLSRLLPFHLLHISLNAFISLFRVYLPIYLVI